MRDRHHRQIIKHRLSRGGKDRERERERERERREEEAVGEIGITR
jgi:hypothetical protein